MQCIKEKQQVEKILNKIKRQNRNRYLKMQKPILFNTCNLFDLHQNMFTSQQSRFPLGVPHSTCSPCHRRSLIFSDSSSSSQPQTTVESMNVKRSLASQLRHGSLTDDGLAYEQKFIVGSREVGMHKTATIQAIADFLQENACNHVESFGFSTDGLATSPTMRKLHLIWVASRMHIEVYKYPTWGDVIEIKTWIQNNVSIGIRRDWIIKDSTTGIVTGRATSKWVMMNQDTRRFQKVSDEVKEEYLIHCARTPRHAFPEKDNSSLKRIPNLEDPVQYSKLGLAPRRSDLDLNQHVNNVTYIGWVTECIPQEIFETHELQKITLDYKLECHLDDVVDSFANLEPDNANTHWRNESAITHMHEQNCLRFVHSLRQVYSGLEINRSQTVWTRRLTR